ncbi:MAG TPA: hypothetical protein VMF53_01310 [Alphaproteobacteria bacterium]|nr:hypothetical protein [Alphaproteobacteria bacterium]
MSEISMTSFGAADSARARNAARKIAGSWDMILVLAAWLASWGGVFLAIEALHSVF